LILENLEEEHLGIVVWILTVRGAEKRKNVRGYEVQRERREMERAVRMRAVDLAGRLKKTGHPRGWIASRLGVSTGALADWVSRKKSDGLAARARGRPIEILEMRKRQAIWAVLDLLGPFEGLPVLQERFPDVARAELEHQLRLYRKKFVGENHVDVIALRWLSPGAVWAIDFNEPPNPIDGIYKAVFKVRDLGSGKALAWLPTYDQRGKGVAETLEVLFKRHGAPLTIKRDNGSSLASEEVSNVMEKWGVVFLVSPPYYPEYNGSIESGIGTLSTYAHHEAARNSRPGEWTCDDVEAARLRANELSRPHGLRGPSPDEVWRNRDPINQTERVEFRKLLEKRYEHDLDAMRKEKDEALSMAELATARRGAITWALVESDILSIRRRRISPPIKSKFWSRIKG